MMTKGSERYIPSGDIHLKGKKVLICNGSFYAQAVMMFTRAGCVAAENIEDCDFVCFLGGSDVNPKLYGEKPIPGTNFSAQRDFTEQAIYHKAVDLGKPVVGICRGAQLIHVLNGGSLWQDVNNHGKPHEIIDLDEDVILTSSSMHHQMLQQNAKMIMLAVCNEQVSNKFYCETLKIDLLKDGGNQGSELEVEACIYPDTQSILFQGHPETGPEEYTNWFLNKVQDFLFDHSMFSKPIIEEIKA